MASFAIGLALDIGTRERLPDTIEVMWGDLGLVLLGAVLAYAGGFVARRYEQRRQARVELMRLIDELDEAHTQLYAHPTKREPADTFRILAGDINRQAVLIGLKELNDALNLNSLAIRIATAVIANKYAEDQDKAWRMVQEAGEAKDQLTKSGKTLEDVGLDTLTADRDDITEDWADTAAAKAERLEAIKSMIDESLRAYRKLERHNREKLLAIPLSSKTRLYIKRTLRRQ